MTRPPRPRVKKLKAQRIRTSSRFWKPIRYQRWTTSQVTQAGKPAEPRGVEVRDRPRPADRRQVALVAVPERLVVAASEPRLDELGGVAALLHRDGRDAWQVLQLAVLAVHPHHVAEREHLGMAREATGRAPTETRPARSTSAPVASPRRRASDAAVTPAAQITVRAGMCSLSPP